MNPVAITLARYYATRAIKRQMHAQGLKPAHVERSVIASAASAYLRDHPELIEEAAETVRKVPELRTLAARYVGRRKRNQR